MAALFQLLGQLGTGYAQARDTQTTEGNELAMKKAALQERMAQLKSMEESRAAQIQLREWLSKQQDNRTAEVQADIAQRQQLAQEAALKKQGEEDKARASLEGKRQQDRLDLETARYNHAQKLLKSRTAMRAGGRGGSQPLEVQRWYRALGGGTIDTQIRTLEQQLKTMELTSLGDPAALYQNQLYGTTQAQLKELYSKSDALYDQAMQRAGAAPTSKPPDATAPGFDAIHKAQGGQKQGGDLNFDKNGNLIPAPTSP
jgi:hypothetical protein